MTAHSVEQPPAVQPVNSVELASLKDSKIVAVSVYSGRAEITRVFTFDVKTGQNQVTINGLPDVLDKDSLRVEGRGAATIHDVAISFITRPEPVTTSSTIAALTSKRQTTTNTLERTKKSISSLESYLASMDVKSIDVTQVRQIVKEYEAIAEELDNRTLELKAQLQEIGQELIKERASLEGPAPDRLNNRAVIGVFADVEGQLQIVLVYAVREASWTPRYDIRVDTNAQKNHVTLVYKAAITQNTGEDWSDVPLTLETATPTFGVGLPKLEPWNLSIYSPLNRRLVAPTINSPALPAALRSMAPPAPAPFLIAGRGERLDSLHGAPAIAHRELEVASKGNVSATFQVPGLINIPSDGVAHNVTIVQLQLEATMSWVCVPKKDVKTHLSAKIKNASQYTLLSGTGSVYVDGSFISRSEVPSVTPDESFNCSLGLDPSIRVTYHPRTKKKSESGFYTKSATSVFTQTITVHNSKSVVAERVRISDQIPISEDTQIQVKLVSPSLTLKETQGSVKDVPGGNEKPVAVSKGVVAMWEGADGPGTNMETLGREGKFNWVCTVPPQSKINLVLLWEVIAPAEATVLGLP